MQREKRKYQRRSLDFLLEIKGANEVGELFQETTRLINISGGGAQFITPLLEQYYEGQVLKASIFLPGTRDVNGRMNTTATVVRLAKGTKNSVGRDADPAKVSVCFQETFQLLRVDGPARKMAQDTQSDPG